MGLTNYQKKKLIPLQTIFQSDDFNADLLALNHTNNTEFLSAEIADMIFEMFASAEMIISNTNFVDDFFAKYNLFWAVSRERIEKLETLINTTLLPARNYDVTKTTQHGHTIAETQSGSDTKTQGGTNSKTQSGTDVETLSGTDTNTQSGKDTITVDNTTTDTASGADTQLYGEQTVDNYRATFDSSDPVPTDSTSTAEHTDTTTYGKVDSTDIDGTTETEYGRTDTTQYGKTNTTQYGKTDTTRYEKTDTTQYGKSDSTTHSGTDTVHEYGTKGNFDLSELLKNAVSVEKALFDLRVLYITDFVRNFCV